MEADEIHLNACLYIAKMEENILLSPLRVIKNSISKMYKQIKFPQCKCLLKGDSIYHENK